jgi:glutathione synthase/RimK-type ligase-like ATP-grasp enzyme
MSAPDLVVIHEHPEWQEPLFAALKKRGVSFEPFDLKKARFEDRERPGARLYFNQASPSAYVRGNTRAVPLNLALLRHLKACGADVINGADVFALELSKSAQHSLLRSIDVDCPRSIVFNDASALQGVTDFPFPALIKPDQGGSGARIAVVNDVAEVARILEADPSLWLPDNLYLLQELCAHDTTRGIVRLEFLGGELLYAMRVVTHGRFNLCPAPVCNPDDPAEGGACAVPDTTAKPVEFYPFPEVPDAAVATAKRIVAAVGMDVGGIEYLETPDGRRVFYDINANSNLRPSIAQAFGFDPFERVVDYLVARLERVKKAAP